MIRNRNRIAVIGAIAVTLCGQARVAWGQDATCPEMDRVPRADRHRARALAKDAAREHKQLKYKRAAELYREAARLWPRPELFRQAGIAYAQAAELWPAYEYLEHALRCGREVLDEDKYKDAMAVMKRLRPWFAELEVQCRQPGLAVSLDGESWFTCPNDGTGGKHRVVLVGQHEVVARDAGYIDMRVPVLVSAGERGVVEARLVPNEQATIATRRWASWKPWAVVAGAAGLAAVGGGLYWSAEQRLNDYVGRLENECPPRDCARSDAEALTLAYHDRAIVENRVALGLFAVSGAALITGLTLVYMNRLQPRLNPKAGRGEVHLVPAIGRDGAGASVRWTF